MIKIFVLLVLTIVIPDRIHAQSYYIEDPKPFTGGLILGANISKVADIDADVFSIYHKVGFNTGGIVHINFTPTFSVAIEILYSQKGAIEINETNSYSIGPYFSEYYLRLNYIEVPVTIHLKQKKFDYEIGASWSRLITSYEAITIDQPVILDPTVFYFNKTDYEFLIGGSYNFYKHYYINVRWQFSMVPIRPWERMPLTYYAFDGQQNNVFNIRLIYML